MGKKRLNITVDEWVKDELQRRDDINISGAANEFFIEYLGGADKDVAAKRARIKQLQDEEEELQKKAQQKRSERKKLENDLEEQQEDRQEKLRKLQAVPDNPDHPLVQEVADELGITPEDALEQSKKL